MSLPFQCSQSRGASRKFTGTYNVWWGCAEVPSVRLVGSSLTTSLTLPGRVTEASTELTSKLRAKGQAEVFQSVNNKEVTRSENERSF